MSDRIAVINHGRIEQLGDATEIYHAPATAFTADFIGEANLLQSNVVYRNGILARVRLTEGVELAVKKETLQDATTQALLSVRPEKIYITKTRPAKENAFRGTIEEEVFRGAMDELRIRIGGTPGSPSAGLTLLAMVPNESSHERSWHKGDTVFCTIHTDDIVVVEQKA